MNSSLGRSRPGSAAFVCAVPGRVQDKEIFSESLSSRNLCSIDRPDPRPISRNASLRQDIDCPPDPISGTRSQRSGRRVLCNHSISCGSLHKGLFFSTRFVYSSRKLQPSRRDHIASPRAVVENTRGSERAHAVKAAGSLDASGSSDIEALVDSTEEHVITSNFTTVAVSFAPWRDTLRERQLERAYDSCRDITERYAKTFYLGTLLMPPEKRRAIWAIYVWCRRTDELVDGPRALRSDLPVVLKEWENRLESVFKGQPCDIYDLALWDTIQRYPQDIEPYRDMIAGMVMDLEQNRYQTFEELYTYCYRVAGTVGLMSTAVMGTEEPSVDVTKEALYLGVANQLTNILRDVGEDARRGRIYLPLEDLEKFDYTEADLMRGIVDDRWIALMKFQIDRARDYFAKAEEGISPLSQDARYPVWASLMLYRQILDVIEFNGYEVFRKRAYVPRFQKLLTLPLAYAKSRGWA